MYIIVRKLGEQSIRCCQYGYRHMYRKETNICSMKSIVYMCKGKPLARFDT